jgi:hypothetical protein
MHWKNGCSSCLLMCMNPDVYQQNNISHGVHQEQSPSNQWLPNSDK